MAEPHKTLVTYQHAWDEWRARCSCGWTGSYMPRKGMADSEAAAHRRGHAPVLDARDIPRGLTEQESNSDA